MESRRKDWPECDDLLSPRTWSAGNIPLILLISFGSFETTIWGGATTRKQLQQTISRLQMLNEAPELPKENILVSRIDSTRRLGISRENEIASNLAFLFAASDDSLK